MSQVGGTQVGATQVGARQVGDMHSGEGHMGAGQVGVEQEGAAVIHLVLTLRTRSVHRSAVMGADGSVSTDGSAMRYQR